MSSQAARFSEVEVDKSKMTTIATSSSTTTSTNRGVNVRDSLRYFVAGNIAGQLGVIVGQPFDTIKVRLQTQAQLQANHMTPNTTSSIHNSSYHPSTRFSTAAHAASYTSAPARAVAPLYTSPLQCMFSTLRTEGIRGLYRGMSSPLLFVGIQKSVAFSVFGTVAQYLQKDDPLPSLRHVCIAGIAGGMANSFILTPVDQIKITMQIHNFGRKDGVAPPHHGPVNQSPSMFNTARLLIEQQGFVRGLYGNYPATLMREVAMYSVYYTIYSYLHRTFIVDHLNRSRWTNTTPPIIKQQPQSDEESTLTSATTTNSSGNSVLNFLSLSQQENMMKLMIGGMTGIGCWASCYFLDVLKSNMVTQTACNVPFESRKSIPEMARSIYAQGGAKAFYRGLSPALLRAFPVHAVVFFTFASTSEWLEKHGL